MAVVAVQQQAEHSAQLAAAERGVGGLDLSGG